MIFDTLLVTGCGGDIGLALARIAREEGVARRLVGCDIHGDHPGAHFFDHCETVPRATDPGYLDALGRLVAAQRVDAIVPMSEAELTTLLAHDALEVFGGVPVVAASRRAVGVGLDKLETSRVLRAAGLGTPWTRVVGDEPPCELPCILKQRRGQGSKGLMEVGVGHDIARLGRERAGDLWQELLLPADREYTCGLYRSRAGETRTIVLRRSLRGGLTGAAEVADPAPFAALLGGIADALELVGSINVQLRLTADGPKVFEINPRFSSTVGFRHRLGFRDFVWALAEQRGLPVEPYVPPPAGIRMYRAATEIILTQQGF